MFSSFLLASIIFFCFHSHCFAQQLTSVVKLNKITVLFTLRHTHIFADMSRHKGTRAYRVPNHLLASAIHTTVLCVCSDSMACEGESPRSQLEHTKHPSLLFFLLHISSFRTQQLPSPERHSEPLKCYILLNFWNLLPLLFFPHLTNCLLFLGCLLATASSTTFWPKNRVASLVANRF